MELLRAGKSHDVAALAAADPRTLRFVTLRLWDGDEEIARRSAEALALALQSDPERGRESIRRFLWALNDESGTNAEPVLMALAEMARFSPQILRPYAGSLPALLVDEGLAAGVVEVIERLVMALPGAADDLRADVRAVMARVPDDLASRLEAVLDLEAE